MKRLLVVAALALACGGPDVSSEKAAIRSDWPEPTVTCTHDAASDCKWCCYTWPLGVDPSPYPNPYCVWVQT
jgi:hypothetical protein